MTYIVLICRYSAKTRTRWRETEKIGREKECLYVVVCHVWEERDHLKFVQLKQILAMGGCFLTMERSNVATISRFSLQNRKFQRHEVISNGNTLSQIPSK